ncbi:MAG: hypothetical protein J6R13_05840 [Alistipes sp.]|nr:hypothetical protein [Alistipes sp.]
MKRIDAKKTLAYYVAFHLCGCTHIDFRLGKKVYQYINTIYDQRADGRGYNTLAVAYDYSAQKYIVLNVSDEKIGNKEIEIINH